MWLFITLIIFSLVSLDNSVVFVSLLQYVISSFFFYPLIGRVFVCFTSYTMMAIQGWKGMGSLLGFGLPLLSVLSSQHIKEAAFLLLW